MANPREYRLSQEADQDLEDIFEYTQSEFGLNQAIDYLNECEVIFSQLLQNPKMGRTRNEIKQNLRCFPKGSHIIFYRILQDHIRIVRILHASRDYPQFFEE